MSDEFREFDRAFNQIQRRAGLFWRLWLIWVGICLLLGGGFLYVVFHFLAKLW